MLLWIVTLLFLIIYASLIFYYYYHWQQLKDYEPAPQEKSVSLSVIIAARNEEKTLPQLLYDLQQQPYAKENVEVIVADDFSGDYTFKMAEAFGAMAVQPEGSSASSSKKKAIEAGIKKATGELIIITDADCTVPPNWLQTIAGFYQDTNAVFIAAPVKYSYNHTLLQTFQAIDFLVLQGITAASVSAKFHTMCNGANLAYTKNAFQRVNGFAGIDAIASGDDMLLMYKMYKLYPHQVLYLKSKAAIVTTQPMLTWKDFINQRKRWGSKTLHYQDYRITAVLAFVYLFNVLFIVLLAAALLHPFYWWLVCIYLIMKIGVELPFVYAVARFYNEEKLGTYLILFQPLHIVYTVIVGALSQAGTYQWKGRTTK